MLNDGQNPHQQGNGREQWSTIEEGPLYVEKLRILCHSQKELRRVGYVLAAFSDEKLAEKRRCQKCGSRVKKRSKNIFSPISPKNTATEPSFAELSIETDRPLSGTDKNIAVRQIVDSGGRIEDRLQAVHISDGTNAPDNEKGDTRQKVVNRIVCSYHSGFVREKRFSCCERHVTAPGCVSSANHSPALDSESGLREYWTFHSTPTLPSSRQLLKSKSRAQRDAPATRRFRAAVALDCEMGTASSGESEVIRISMVDFFTQEVLLDSLVQPSIPMRHYNTRFSGVTAADMRRAVRERTCIFGRDMVRQLIWQSVGPDTVIVAHGGHNDLSALRLIHPLIIDSFILESYGEAAVGGRSLKNLCLQRLGRVVQNKTGHCSLEDTLACRELVHWFARQIPD